MYRIDVHAHGSRLRQVHPLGKFTFALAVISLCLVLNRPAVSVAALLWMAGLSILGGGAPPMLILRLLTAEGFFLGLSVITVAVQIAPGGSASGWTVMVTPCVDDASRGVVATCIGLRRRHELPGPHDTGHGAGRGCTAQPRSGCSA